MQFNILSRKLVVTYITNVWKMILNDKNIGEERRGDGGGVDGEGE